MSRAITPSDRDKIVDLAASGHAADDLAVAYRSNGSVRIRSVLSSDEVSTHRSAAEAFPEAQREPGIDKSGIFSHLVNVWQHDATMLRLTLHARLGRHAEQLAGSPLRVWHDQMLVNASRNAKDPTTGSVGGGQHKAPSAPFRSY